MAVTTHTLTGDLTDLAGAALVDDWSLRTPLLPRVRIETNIPDGEPLVDTSTGGSVMLGSAAVDLADDLTFSVDLPDTSSTDLNWVGLRFRLITEYPDAGTRTRGGWTSPYFTLTADRDIRSVVEDEYAPPTPVSAIYTQMQALLAAMEAIAGLDGELAPLLWLGIWDASTNIPTLADGVGPLTGGFYIVAVPGAQDLGSGELTFNQFDFVRYDGAVWTRIDSGLPANPVAAVALNTVMVYGTIDTTDGSIVDGTGFSVVRNTTGIVTVTFDVPFTSRPVVTMQATTTTADGAQGPVPLHKEGFARTGTSFQAELVKLADGVEDGTFEFIAVGPQ